MTVGLNFPLFLGAPAGIMRRMRRVRCMRIISSDGSSAELSHHKISPWSRDLLLTDGSSFILSRPIASPTLFNKGENILSSQFAFMAIPTEHQGISNILYM